MSESVITIFRAKERKLNTTEFEQCLPPLPFLATKESAAYDLSAYLPAGSLTLAPLTVVKVRTGLSVSLPAGSSLLVCSRSGLASRGIVVANAPGIIDSDYRDEIAVLLTYIAPPTAEPVIIEHGMRIAQTMFHPAHNHPVQFHEVDDRFALNTRRVQRTGGFGSTGDY